MDHSHAHEGPAILRLKKWDPEQVRLKLSRFREAFISPTRELLVLLSHQREAMLFPLSTGDSVDKSDPGSLHDEVLQDPGCETSRSADPTISGSVPMSCDGDPLHGKICPNSSNYPFIYDVNSVAWGVLGDAYNEHKDALFKEFLFVRGEHGVTAHVFCYPKKSTEMMENLEEAELEDGVWVEWGPSTVSAYRTEAQENDGAFSSERWLQTFLTSVETVECDGNVCTRFPGKKSYPSSVRTVSFSIFRNTPLLDFLSSARSLNNKERWSKTDLRVLDDTCMDSHSCPSAESMPDVFSNFLGIGENIFCSCSRVFSSNCHHLIGFVLCLWKSVCDSSVEKKTIVAVARLEEQGLHWLCSVNLENCLNMSLEVDWADFRFSDNLLACLTAAGLIFFFDVMTGKCVACLNILKICGLNALSNSQESEKIPATRVLASRRADTKTERQEEFYPKLAAETQDLCSKIMFKRLIVALHTSFLAAVDEHGAVYIICVGDFVPNELYSYEKLFPHFRHLGLGMLIGWKVGSSEISQQRAFSRSTALHGSDSSPFLQGRVCLEGFGGTSLNKRAQERSVYEKGDKSVLHGAGFFPDLDTKNEIAPASVSSSQLLRNIFLPLDKSSGDDVICFSPFGITRLNKQHDTSGRKCFHLVHSSLHVGLKVHDDRCLYPACRLYNLLGMEEACVREVVGCAFQGCFYLVTEAGLSVVLPSVSVPSHRHRGINMGIGQQVGSIFACQETTQPCSGWKIEVIDRVIVCEGSALSDHLCSENGWDLKISRMRQLQLSLDYLKFDEIQRSLEMLASANLAEEGMLRLLFVVVYLTFHRVGNGNEFPSASRLLALGTQFATKMIRQYGLEQNGKDAVIASSAQDENSQRLKDMARYLEIIRNVQRRLSMKFSRHDQGFENERNGVDGNLLQVGILPFDPPGDATSLEIPNEQELNLVSSSLGVNISEELALVPMDPLKLKGNMESDIYGELSIMASQGELYGKKALPFENPKDMVARWEAGELDVKAVIKDALFAGRLPLAVLQLHLYRLKKLVADNDPLDTFTEVRAVGKAIAYDLFLEGQTRLAVATLQRLGEDVEISLKELAFGTVRGSLRIQISELLKRHGYLGPEESMMLERMSLIERFYPCRSFWATYFGRQKKALKISSSTDSSKEHILYLLHSHLLTRTTVSCGEIDGVVMGSWTDSGDNSAFPVVDEDANHAAYWAAAAMWSNAWDRGTIDRIVLDQPLVTGTSVLWESQLEYHVCHNDWDEVSKLLDAIPLSLLLDGSLRIRFGDSNPCSNIWRNWLSSDNGSYLCTPEEFDNVFMDVLDVKFFVFSAKNMSSTWLRMLIEQKLAKKFIFMREFWGGAAEIVPLLSSSGFITGRTKIYHQDEYAMNSPDISSASMSGAAHAGIKQDFHRLIVHYCALYNLPNFLGLYLDHHNLFLDNDSLASLLESAGDCQWAKWLLLSRIRGRGYDASFANARSIMSHNVVPCSKLSVLEVDDIIQTVDDIAEGGCEMAALATLMFAPLPIQDCLSSGSANRHRSFSAQCTLENLRKTLQRFPTLWQMLVAVCLGQDSSGTPLNPAVMNVFGNPTLSDYLNWRTSMFFSVGRDTSLVEMLPSCLSRAVRRLVQLYVQGPFSWHSVAGAPKAEALMDRETEFLPYSNEDAMIILSREIAIQKHIEEELYTSSIKETGPGLEPQLHRGRALSAFNRLLRVRIEKFKMESTEEGQLDPVVHRQENVQRDMQRLLAPVTENEEFLLSSVKPLAIINFEDSVVVASCAFLLELCGLSVSMLRADVAALNRISSFQKSSEYVEHPKQHSPKGSFHPVSHESDITYSLAQALADYYRHHTGPDSTEEKGAFNSSCGEQPARALVLVLQHLERASLPSIAYERTCGTWLVTGEGDGTQLRTLQKAASQHWNLVTVFCQMHQIPLSTKYLAVLAKDNDWVGFLSEAQIGGYPLDTVIQVASKEFCDQRLKVHILTVLRGMQLKKKATSLNFDTFVQRNGTGLSDEHIYFPVDLFRILAESEQEKNPGMALLIRAKELCWSILAMLASCFSDVSQLSCLAVWLEITAARETSSIKVNDIASEIATNVDAAVQATNSLLVETRAPTIHYSRRNAKRRCLMQPFSLNTSESDASNISSVTAANSFFGERLLDEKECQKESDECSQVSSDSDERLVSLSKMVAVLCEQQLFLPLLRAFELFLPSCSLLPFIRALQAFSQMRLSDASAHLGSFSVMIKEESLHVQSAVGREEQVGVSWISSTAKKAADAVFSRCPSPYEKRCLLQLLAATDFSDGGLTAAYYQRFLWKINFAEPLLRKDDKLHLGSETLDDASLLTAFEKNGHWEHARNWAKQLEAGGGPWKSSVHHVTETQAESMIAEWKEFLWDVTEERVALWGHCQMLFLRHSFPPLQAGLFFLKHAEAVEKDLPARELHELLLLSLQWLSGMTTQSNCVYPLHLLRELETRVWLLAVESESQVKREGGQASISFIREPVSGNDGNIIDRTARIILKMDNHINLMRNSTEKNDARENTRTQTKNLHVLDAGSSSSAGGSAKTKRRVKGYASLRRPLMEMTDQRTDGEDGINPPSFKIDLPTQIENSSLEMSFSRWEERVAPADLERAVLSLLEFGQIAAAKQLQQKLSSALIPSEFSLVDAALKLATISTTNSKVSVLDLDRELRSVMQSYNILPDSHLVDPFQVLGTLATVLPKGGGQGICKRIIAIQRAAQILGISFTEAFDKPPIEALQLLSLKAQDSFEEAKLLVQSHSMPAASIARVLAESFLKGLLAAHRGGYMDFQKEEGPAPLLWRFSDFLKWVELCPSEAEIGHALMCLVITGQEIPHACEVELLILSHHFYRASACLDGVDVLVSLAATRVEAYVSEGDFTCLARLITGVGNFHALDFILGILIENGQLDLLLQKFSAVADTNAGTAEAVRGFRMTVLTSLKLHSPDDLDAFAAVYNHFDMKHETAALLELRAEQSSEYWFSRDDKYQNEELLESMRYYIEAAEVHSSMDAGNKTRAACAQASLVSLQIRIPDFRWLNLSDTNARRTLVDQSRFQEALIVAEAYRLNSPSEWAPVLWNQMLKPELTEQFVAEFMAVLPLRPSMLLDIARFYRAEVTARGDQSQFSVWLTGGGLPAEWAKYLGRSFRCLLRETRDWRLRLQLATAATGFGDVVGACMKVLDRVPDTAGPLVLRKGHGGAYRPLM